MEVSNQKAGDNASLINAGGNVYVNPSLGELATVVTSMCNTFLKTTIEQYSKDAHDEVERRLKSFEGYLLPKMQKIQDSLTHLKDPTVQFLVGAAAKSAAQTENVEDYDRLTEMLAYRIANPLERRESLGVAKAIEIVPQIDNDALQFLTYHYIIVKCTYNINGFPFIEDVLKGLDELYGKFPIPKAYNSEKIVDHLALLDAIRINQVSRFINGVDYIRKSNFSGFDCLGILKDSDGYRQALNKLTAVGLGAYMLVENKFNPQYVRIGVARRGVYEGILIMHQTLGVPTKVTGLTDLQRTALLEIENLYVHNNKLENDVSECVNKCLRDYSNVAKAIDFWDSQKVCFSLTAVGEALANVNARLYEKRIPDAIKG